jgi:hypothetical protein
MGDIENINHSTRCDNRKTQRGIFIDRYCEEEFNGVETMAGAQLA